MWAGGDVSMEEPNNSQMSPDDDGDGDKFDNSEMNSALRVACVTPCSLTNGSRKSAEQADASNDYDEEFFTDREFTDQTQEISDWMAQFMKLSRGNQRLALTTLIESTQMPHIRHMRQLIEPHFQRDFLSCLPIELAVHILTFMEPKDKRQCCNVSKTWRIISEAEHIWRAHCEQIRFRLNHPTNRIDNAWAATAQATGVVIHDHVDPDEWTRIRNEKIHGKFGSINKRAPMKSMYMRKVEIRNNWLRKSIKGSAILRGHDDHVITCMQIHDDILVTGSDDNSLKVWSIDKGECLFTLVGHTGGVWTSQVSNDGRYIVSGSTDRTIKVWDTSNGLLLHTLAGHTSTVRCMSMHDSILVTGSRDTTLRVWNFEKGLCFRVLSGHQAAVRCVQFDGETVVSGGYDFTVKIWRVTTGVCEKTLYGHTNRVYSLLFDSDRRIVVSGSLDTSIRVWDLNKRDREECIAVLQGHTSLTSGMQLRGNILVSCNADSHVRVWDIRTASCIHLLTGPNGHRSAITSLQFFDDQIVATSSDDGTVKLWDVHKGVFVRNLVSLGSGGNGGCIWRLCASPTLLACAVGSRNNTEETKIILLDFDSTFP